MNLDIFARQLRLLQTLAGNTQLSVGEVCERLDISHRTFYRYIAMFRDQGFDVSNDDGTYSVDLSSPFFSNISEKMRLTASEAQTLCELLEKADPADPRIQRLRQRLRTIYGMEFSDGQTQIDRRFTTNSEAIAQAIRQHKQIILHKYESPHSQTLTDRLVEPFKMVPHIGGVRCYEQQSDQCKTFKISRIKGRVEILKKNWANRSKHITYYTDIFGFSSETVHRITLRLGTLAASILQEEYGVKETQFIIDADGTHRLFAISVCSFEGIGRFVLGLMSDIEIIRTQEFREYIGQQLQIAQTKLRNT